MEYNINLNTDKTLRTDSNHTIGQGKYHTRICAHNFAFSSNTANTPNYKYRDGSSQLIYPRQNYWKKIDSNFEPTTIFNTTIELIRQ